MSQTKKQSNFLIDVAKLIAYSNQIGIALTGGDLFRSEEQQAIYFKSGDSTIKHSKHQDRLAIDFNFFINGKLTYKKSDLQILGDYWEDLTPGNQWGGNWKTFVDTPHFQAP